IGINVTASASNTTVKNCIINDWTEGIQDNSANSLFINIRGSSCIDGFFAGNLPQASGTKVLDSTFNSNVYGINDRGSNTNFTNITANSNSNYGIIFDGKTTGFANMITANSNSWHGIFSAGGSGHTVINSIISNSGRDGWRASGTSVSGFNNTFSGNAWVGFANIDSTLGTFENMTFINNTQWDINVSTTTTVNNLRNLDLIGNSNITLTSAIAVALRNGTAPMADPANYTNISKWINASATAGSPFMAINITYLASDIPAGWFEGNLSWAKFNGTGWVTNASLFTNDFGVDTVNNIVWANITDFTGKELMFAPLINNITSTADTIVPIIAYVAPTEVAFANLSRGNIIVNVTATDAGGLDTIITRLFNSTSLYNTSSSTTSPFYLNFTGLADGTWYFNSTANDTANNEASTATRQVLIDTVNPSIQINSPANGANYTTGSFTANISGSDTNFVNLTLRLYNSTGLANETTITTTSLQVTYFGLADGTYTFNGTASDLVAHENNTATRTIYIDTAVANIQFVTPTEVAFANLTRRNILVNVTASDSNLANITIYLFNSTILINETTIATSPHYLNISVSADGTYYFNATATDLLGNKNSTGTRTINIDATIPSIQFVSPTEANNSYVTRRFILINTTATDTNLKNITIYLFNTTVLINETSAATSPLYLNISVNADGNYTFNSTAYDVSGNANSTSTRLTIVDTVKPAINFTSPTETNGSALTTRNIKINVTATDTNLANITVYVFNSTGAYNETTTTTSPNYVSVSVTADGTYIFNATAIDLSGNKNNTDTRSVSIATSSPAAPATTTLAAGSSAGAGGGSIGTRSDSIAVNLEAGGQPAQITGFSSTVVQEISITANQKTDAVLVSAGLLTLPPKTELENVIIYKYLEIRASGLDADRILSAGIKFKVENNWIQQNSNAETIVLYRYSNGWQALPTRMESADAEFTYYSAKTPGFSLFAIAGDAPAPKKEAVAEIVNKTIEILKSIPATVIPKQTNFNLRINPITLLGVLAVILLVIGIGSIDFKKLKQALAVHAKENKRLKEYRLALKRRLLARAEEEHFAKNVRYVSKSFSSLEGLFKSRKFAMAMLFVLAIGGFIALAQNPASQNFVTGAVASVSEINIPAIDTSLISPIYILILVLAATLVSGMGYYVGSAVKQKHLAAKPQVIRRPAFRAPVVPNYEWAQKSIRAVQKEEPILIQKKPAQIIPSRSAPIQLKPQMILETAVKKEVQKLSAPAVPMISEKPARLPKPEKMPKHYRVAEEDVRLAK
ncbi:MAG: PGF-pre-PGF domain-containing protein, partial [Nanoarchaeota archaeon]